MMTDRNCFENGRDLLRHSVDVEKRVSKGCLTLDVDRSM